LKKFVVLAVFLILVLSFCVLMRPLVLAEQGDAESAVVSAEQQIEVCYSAARAAEAAGANVSSLMGELNVAGDLLSRADVAYRAGDFASAISLASQSEQVLGNFVSEANALRFDAIHQRNYDLIVDGVESGVGLVLLCVLGLLGWRFVSRWYGRRVLGLKPVVRGNYR
jgi:hypothetical protein